MPANKSALIRYAIIDRMIRNKYRPFPTKEMIREECEAVLYGSRDGLHISVSTIDKDIKALKYEQEFNAPIEFSKKDNGYFYTDPEFALNMPITEEHIKTIRIALDTLKEFSHTAKFVELQSTIERLCNRLAIPMDDNSTPANEIIQFERVPYFKNSEFVPVLFELIREKKAISFTYTRYTDEVGKHHEIDPYLLKEYHNRWYVIGWNSRKQCLSTYGLDRMEQIQETGKSFYIRKDFNPAEFFKYCFGITSADEEPQEVILSFTPLQGKYIKTQMLHHTQQIISDNEKELKIALRILITWEFVQYILSQGKTVKVIKPRKLAAKIKTLLKEAISQYE